MRKKRRPKDIHDEIFTEENNKLIAQNKMDSLSYVSRDLGSREKGGKETAKELKELKKEVKYIDLKLRKLKLETRKYKSKNR